MSKNIVICSDGTGNTAIKGRGTNVFKLYEALDTNGHRQNPSLTPQIAFYDDGVGTERLKYLRMLSGATGWGLSRNVKELYVELARVYDPGDRIYLFGFSRGAFTVRTLAGLIAECGILNARRFSTRSALEAVASRAYRQYRRKYQTDLSKLIRGPRVLDSEAFRRENCVCHDSLLPGGRASIEFIGVWDTVDAVGAPFHIADLINRFFYRFKFPDATLNERVGRACHALALDEERQSFVPVLWNQSVPSDQERIEQVWFAGAHSNVGGGYPRQGMSLVSLDWMMGKAEEQGLRFLPDDRTYYRDHHAVDDKLYDPRAGIGVFYRWKPRDVGSLSQRCGISRPRMHFSVFERIARATEGYAPGNIPPQCEIVTTPGDRLDVTPLATLLSSAHDEGPPLRDQAKPWIGVGLTSYYVFLATLAVFFYEWMERNVAQLDSPTWLDRLQTLANPLTAVLSGGIGALDPAFVHTLTAPELLGLLAGGLALAYVLAETADRQMERLFSDFWHRHQLGVRAMLGYGRTHIPETTGAEQRVEVV